MASCPSIWKDDSLVLTVSDEPVNKVLQALHFSHLSLSDSLLAFKPEEMTDEELNRLLEQLEETDLKANPDPETPESDPDAAGKTDLEPRPLISQGAIEKCWQL